MTTERADAAPVSPAPAPKKQQKRVRIALLPSPESRLGTFFLGFILALVPGVAATLWAISYLSDNISQLLNIALLAILVVSSFGTLLVLMQGRLFRWLGFRVRSRMADIAAPLYDAVVRTVDGDIGGATERLKAATERFASWYSWFSLRRWIVGITVGLMAGFAALIGSALLHEQNKLIAAQNLYFQAQNDKLQQEIDLTRSQSNALRRSQLIATLYDRRVCDTPPCPPQASSRSRAEAFRALVLLDGDVRADYSGVDLRGAVLDGLSLSNVRLRNADLRAASLRDVDLRDADLTGASLSSADLDGADLDGAKLTRTDLRRAWLGSADITSTTLLPDNVAEARRDDATDLPIEENAALLAATRLVATPTQACASCCGAFRLGLSAARFYGSGGRATSEERQDLTDELALLGVDAIPSARGARAGSIRGHIHALFAYDDGASDLLAKASPVVTQLHGAVAAEDAFYVGLYLGHVQLHPPARRSELSMTGLQSAVLAIAGAGAAAGPRARLAAVTEAGGDPGLGAALAAYEDASALALGCGAQPD